MAEKPPKVLNPPSLQSIALKIAYRDMIQAKNHWHPLKHIDQIYRDFHVPYYYRKIFTDLQTDTAKLYEMYHCMVPRIRFEEHAVIENGKLEVLATLKKLREGYKISQQMFALMCFAGMHDEAFFFLNPFIGLTVEYENENMCKHLKKVVCCIHKFLFAHMMAPFEERYYTHSFHFMLNLLVNRNWTQGIKFLFRILRMRRHLFRTDCLEGMLIRNIYAFEKEKDYPGAAVAYKQLFAHYWRYDFLELTKSFARFHVTDRVIVERSEVSVARNPEDELTEFACCGELQECHFNCFAISKSRENDEDQENDSEDSDDSDDSDETSSGSSDDGDSENDSEDSDAEEDEEEGPEPKRIKLSKTVLAS